MKLFWRNPFFMSLGLFLLAILFLYETSYFVSNLQRYLSLAKLVGSLVTSWLFLCGISWAIAREFKGRYLIHYVVRISCFAILTSILFFSIFRLDNIWGFVNVYTVVLLFTALLWLFQILTPHVPTSKAAYRIFVFLIIWNSIIYTAAIFAPKKHLQSSIWASSFYGILPKESLSEFEKNLKEVFFTTNSL